MRDETGSVGTMGRRRRSSAALALTGEFRLQIGGVEVVLPHSVERLVAFLALARRPVARSRVAGNLWSDASEARSSGSLRSALWRLRDVGWPVVRSLDRRLELSPEVTVDAIELTAVMERLLGRPDRRNTRPVPEIASAREILPDWDEADWLAIERVRYARLRLEALEAAAKACLEIGDTVLAVEAALAATEADPFRESAIRLLISAYTAEGNTSQAIQAYRGFRDLVHTELGVDPSESLEAQIAKIQGLATA